MAYAVPLIEKTDCFEQIRDKLAEILAAETASQQALATAGGKDPSDWAFRVYSERSNPWEAFRGADKSPIVNIWYDSSRYDEDSSNTQDRQNANPSRYNLDVYAYAETEETDGGHDPGDELAAKRAHAIARLARNLIMHDKYIRLDHDEVWKRRVSELTAFQPRDSGNIPVQHVLAVRIALDVQHNEYIVLADHDTLEVVNVKFYYEPDGQVIAELQYGSES